LCYFVFRSVFNVLKDIFIDKFWFVQLDLSNDLAKKINML